MIDQLKKALTTGVGLAVKTWTEVETAGKEMINKAELSESDAHHVLKSLKESYEKTQEKMEVQVDAWSRTFSKKPTSRPTRTSRLSDKKSRASRRSSRRPRRPKRRNPQGRPVRRPGRQGHVAAGIQKARRLKGRRCGPGPTC